MVAASDELMAALRAVRSLGLRSWCIGAGAIRSLVWDTLHGFDRRSAVEDLDVVYFDVEASPEQDAGLENQLRSAMPGFNWEVTNQAAVHRWLAAALGQVVPPLASLEEGVATWPEFATCVGVWLNEDGSLGVVAPHGLDDLFALRVRHNPCGRVLRPTGSGLQRSGSASAGRGFWSRWAEGTECGQQPAFHP